MTLTQLRYVVAVDRYGSFAGAARQCLVTQPTLSLQIQKLEQEIGQEIFDRRKNPVTTTGYGRKIVDQAKAVLREADKISEMFVEDDDEPSGEISIGMIPTISSYLMPHLYKRLSKSYKKLEFRIYELPTTQIIDQIEKEELDLGVLATPLHMKPFVETPLYYEPFVAYFPKDYRGKREKLTFENIEQTGQELILLGEEHCFRNQSLQVCGRASAGKLECGSLDTIKKMVDLGAGMTLLPLLSLGKAEMKRTGRFAEPQPAREVSLIYKKGFYKKKVLSAVRDVILEAVPEELRSKEGRRLIGIDVV